jgi:hypothetical protein
MSSSGGAPEAPTGRPRPSQARTWLCGLCCTLAGAAGAADAQDAAIRWEKFVSAGGKFSLHHPAGWGASEKNGAVALGHPATREEMLVLGLTFDAAKSPEELARPVLDLLRRQLPDLQVRDSRGDDAAARFDVTFTSGESEQSGTALVAKSGEQAIWVSYSAPSRGFDKDRGARLIAGVLASVSPGTGSRPPPGPAPGGKGPGTSGAGASRADPEPAIMQSREALLGDWGTNAVYGSVRSKQTGEYLRVSGYGTSYSFRADGTFTYLMVGSGTVVSGAATKRGTFETRGNQLILHVTASAWTPSTAQPGQRPAWDWKPQDRTESHVWSITRRDDGREQLTVDGKGLHRE